MKLHRKDWVEKLPEELWVYRTTWINTTGHTPYEIVYGKQVFLPIEFHLETFRTTTKLGLDLLEAQKQRLAQLNELDKIQQDVIQRTNIVQQKRSKWNEKFIKAKNFKRGDWALPFYSKFKIFN